MKLISADQPSAFRDQCRDLPILQYCRLNSTLGKRALDALSILKRRAGGGLTDECHCCT